MLVLINRTTRVEGQGIIKNLAIFIHKFIVFNRSISSKDEILSILEWFVPQREWDHSFKTMQTPTFCLLDQVVVQYM